MSAFGINIDSSNQNRYTYKKTRLYKFTNLKDNFSQGSLNKKAKYKIPYLARQRNNLKFWETYHYLSTYLLPTWVYWGRCNLLPTCIVHSPRAGSSARISSSVMRPRSNVVLTHCRIGDPLASNMLTSTDPGSGRRYLEEWECLVVSLKPSSKYIGRLLLYICCGGLRKTNTYSSYSDCKDFIDFIPQQSMGIKNIYV